MFNLKVGPTSIYCVWKVVIGGEKLGGASVSMREVGLTFISIRMKNVEVGPFFRETNVTNVLPLFFSS